jgi:hypothetical protein
VRGEYDYTACGTIRQRYQDEQDAMYRNYVPDEPWGVEDHAYGDDIIGLDECELAQFN